jgi:hypothetical protein
MDSAQAFEPSSVLLFDETVLTGDALSTYGIAPISHLHRPRLPIVGMT